MCHCCGCVRGMCSSRALFRIAVFIVESGAIPTPVPVGKLSLYWISLQPRAHQSCGEPPGLNHLFVAQAPILCLHLVFSLNPQATRAPCRSRTGPPSNLGVAVSVDASTFEYERHRACLSLKTSIDEPSHVPLHSRTMGGAALWS